MQNKNCKNNNWEYLIWQGPMVCQDIGGVSGTAERAWISRPRMGKHICFDGRYLHAAPADLAIQPSSAVEAQHEPDLLGACTTGGEARYSTIVVQ